VDGKFCSACGQSSDTRPLDWKFLWNDLQRLFSPQDNSFYSSMKALFLRPGDFILEYLNGKRIGHLGPLKLVLALSAINLGLLRTHRLMGAERTADAAQQWIYSHYAVAELALVPLLALASFLGFRRAGYPLAWHFGIAGFLVSQHLAIRIGLLSVGLLFHYTNLRLILVAPQIVAAGLATWAFVRIFSSLTLAQRLWGTLVTYLLFGAATLLTVYVFALCVSK